MEPWLKPARVFLGQFDEKYLKENREFQGIPSIEITKKGRIYAAWQICGDMEPHEDNCICLSVSNDGINFIDPFLVIDHETKRVRLCNPVLWIDPKERLWLFYSSTNEKETPTMGVWYIRIDNPDAELSEIKFTKPKRISDFIIINKPIVTKEGYYLYTAQSFIDRSITYTYRSKNNGKSFKKIGFAKSLNPNTKFSETMLLEKDGTLYQYSRVEGGHDGGMELATSLDGGITWTYFKSDLERPFRGPGTRTYIRKIDENRIIFVNNDDSTKRNNLTLFYSTDNFKTYTSLLIDSRDYVSYPDGAIDSNGDIFIIYDRNRSFAREILMYKTTESEILSGIRHEPILISKGKLLVKEGENNEKKCL